MRSATASILWARTSSLASTLKRHTRTADAVASTMASRPKPISDGLPTPAATAIARPPKTRLHTTEKALRRKASATSRSRVLLTASSPQMAVDDLVQVSQGQADHQVPVDRP